MDSTILKIKYLTAKFIRNRLQTIIVWCNISSIKPTRYRKIPYYDTNILLTVMKVEEQQHDFNKIWLHRCMHSYPKNVTVRKKEHRAKALLCIETTDLKSVRIINWIIVRDNNTFSNEISQSSQLYYNNHHMCY